MPVVDANRCAEIAPAITTSFGRAAASSTRGRPCARRRKRWSSTSHRDHVEPSPYVGRIGRARYGTGLAGSDTYESETPAGRTRSARRTTAGCSARTYSRRGCRRRRGGQLSRDFHVFEPASNVVASGSFSVPLPLSQYANHGASMPSAEVVRRGCAEIDRAELLAAVARSSRRDSTDRRRDSSDASVSCFSSVS